MPPFMVMLLHLLGNWFLFFKIKVIEFVLIVPDRTPLHNSSFVWEFDELPKELTLIPFSITLSPLFPSYLTFLSALTHAYDIMQGIDWAISIYPYPYSVLLELARTQFGYKTIAFLRVQMVMHS